MNPDGHVGCGNVSRCKELFEPSRNASMALFTRELQTAIERHFEHFHRLDVRGYPVCVLYSYYRQMTLGHASDLAKDVYKLKRRKICVLLSCRSLG